MEHPRPLTQYLKMKKILFLLMMVASVASARSDTVLKDLITGTWNYDNCKSGKEFISLPNGTLQIQVEGYAEMKWNIENGELVKIELPSGDPDKWEGKSAGYLYVYTILFLTKHELLVQDKKYKIYTFMYR
jgi:hypothetical protein